MSKPIQITIILSILALTALMIVHGNSTATRQMKVTQSLLLEAYKQPSPWVQASQSALVGPTSEFELRRDTESMASLSASEKAIIEHQLKQLPSITETALTRIRAYHIQVAARAQIQIADEHTILGYVLSGRMKIRRKGKVIQTVSTGERYLIAPNENVTLYNDSLEQSSRILTFELSVPPASFATAHN